MKKIVTLGINLSDEHRRRLASLGNLEEKEGPTSIQDFLEKSEGADILYSNGDFLVESLPKLKNVFVTYPYVEIGAFNSEELKKNNVFVANASGGNRDSVAEWVMFMVLSLFRNFTNKVRAKNNFDFELNESLVGKRVLIIGHGVIGSQIGVLCKAFGMNVDFFDRGNNLTQKANNVDLVINALSCDSTSQNLLNGAFFMNLKKGAYFISFVRPYTYDVDGLINSINKGVIAGAAIDCDPENYGETTNEFYKKLIKNEKILVTAHIAFSTKQGSTNGREITIQNIEAFLKGKPKNILNKK
jgi:phosphoglycerate dehydrogenase-like enzyme